MSRLPTEFECFGGAGNPKPGEPKGKLNSLTKTFNQSINQSFYLVIKAGYKSVAMMLMWTTIN